MSGRRAATVVLLAASLVLGGCGGGESAQDRAAASAAYAGRVSAISTQMERRLAQLADRADYREAALAAASTRDYATSLREAATALAAITPPPAATRQHETLVALYRQTATSLEALAERFQSAPDAAALGVLAQDLSSEVQRYASREQELRGALQRALAAGTTPGR